MQPLWVQAQAVSDPQASTRQEASDTRQDVTSLDTVVTEAKRYEFLNADTSGTTNLPLPIEKVPQSISILSSDFLSAADIRSAGTVAQYTAGAFYRGNPYGKSDAVRLRGFDAGVAVDGLTVSNGAYQPDYALVERLEIVKGPSSVIYGAASPGGLINMTMKSAQQDTPSYVSTRVGMWNNFRVEAQVAGNVDEAGKVRGIVVAVEDKGDSFINEVQHEKSIFYGGFDVDFSDSVTGYLHGGREYHSATSFDGIPTLADGSMPDVARSTFIGNGDYEMETDVTHAEGGVHWDITGVWSVDFKANFQQTNQVGPGVYGYSLKENGDFSFRIQNYLKNMTKNFNLGASTIYRLERLGDESFIAVSLLDQTTNSSVEQSLPLFNGSTVGSANLYSDQQTITDIVGSGAFPGTISSRYLRTEMKTASVQAALQVLDPLSVLLGASYADPKITQVSNGVFQDFSGDAKTSYRGALMYELFDGFNAYVSYSESFQPQTRIDVNDKVVAPLSGKQYELGAKYASSGGRMLLGGSLFEIKQQNQAVFDQSVGGYDRYKAMGEVRHRGLELEATGHITPRWQVNANYTYLDPVITQSDTASEIGKQVKFLPKNTASLYTIYNFLDGFSIGGGMRYVGAQKTSYDDSTRDMPSYVLLDATVSYATGNWLFQLNGENLLDRHYYVNNYDTLTYGNVIGNPANVSLSARYTF